jgi:integrase
VTQESFHGAQTRTPVEHGGRRVPGLHQRTLRDGSTVFEARLRIEGKDRRVVLEATTKSDAVREYQGLRTDRDRGDVQENRLLNPTVDDVSDELLERMQMRVGSRDDKLRVAPATITRYEGDLRLYVRPLLGRKRIADVDIVDLRRLLDALQVKELSPCTVSGVLVVASKLFTFAIKQGYADHNPVRYLDREDRPGSKRLTEPRYLTEEEIGRLLDAAAPVHFRGLFACLAYAGLRNGEARGLQWGDLDFTEGALRIERQIDRRGEIVPTKTASSVASLPMLPALRRELLAHRQRAAETNIALISPGRFVFVRRAAPDRPIPRDGLIDAVVRAGNRAGLNPSELPRVTPHDLRHSFVALAFEHGATLPEIAELARHASPQTTLRAYAGLTKDGRGRAAQKLLDAGFGV